ncbi:uncharacterized, partial [Tachysurus ichikawai]
RLAWVRGDISHSREATSRIPHDALLKRADLALCHAKPGLAFSSGICWAESVIDTSTNLFLHPLLNLTPLLTGEMTPRCPQSQKPHRVTQFDELYSSLGVKLVKLLRNEAWRFKKLPGDEIDQEELWVKADLKSIRWIHD